MQPYIHHAPGRLRVKSPVLKNPTPHAEQIVERLLERLRHTDGIHSAEVNAITGSLVVLYCPKQVSADSLLENVREHGLMTAAPSSIRNADSHSRLTSPLADAIVKKLVDVAIQRSAAALIGALI